MLRKIIYDNIDPWTDQRPHFTKDQIYETICYNLDNGFSYAVEENGLVVLFNAESKYVSRIHIFSDCKSYKIVNSLKNIIGYIFENSEMQKVYGMFQNKKLGALAEKAGWKYHGEMTESAITEHEGMQSLYIWGISKREYCESNLIDK